MPDSPESMTITTRQDGDTALVTIEGELDLHSSAALSSAIAAVLEQPVKAIAIDAGGLTFADSAGLRALLMAHNDAGGRGLAFRISQVSEPLDRLLEMTGLRDVLGVPG